jgi:hypothetical protein
MIMLGLSMLCGINRYLEQRRALPVSKDRQKSEPCQTLIFGDLTSPDMFV